MVKSKIKFFTLFLVLILLIPGCSQKPKDTNPPQVAFTYPQNGQTVSGTVTIQALAIDNVGVAKVEFYIDNTKVGEDTSSPYEYSWNTDTLQYNSQHTIKAKAYDNAGNVGESSVVTVTIGDTQAPQVTIINPQNGATVSGIVLIQVGVVEKSSGKKIEKAPSGITKVEFYIDNTKVGEDTSSPYEYSWNTDTLQYNSQHTIKAKAYDNAGNVGESQIITVTIGDTKAPQIVLINPQNGAVVSGIVKIRVDVIDKISGKKIEKSPSVVYKVEFYIDGVMVWEDTTSPYEYSWDTKNYSNGVHGIMVKAYDIAGNSSSVSIVVNLDNTPPQISITNPQDGETVSGIVAIQAQASDNVGISKVEFYIDNTKVGEDSSFPYEYELNTLNYLNGIHTITAKAFDVAGNSSSASITVNIKNNVWQKTFGGSGYDWAYSIQQTSDGGYIVAGGTWSFGAGGEDVYILKLDVDGNLIWQKTFGGSDNDEARSIQQTKDGGYIVAGCTRSFGAGYEDVYILKLDADGNLLWQKIFGGSIYDEAFSIQQTIDGGYIVAGRTWSFSAGYYDVYILKLDPYGNLEWQKTFGESGWDEVSSIQQTGDGGYIVAGRTDSFGEGCWDVYILKLNANGDLVWQKTFGGNNCDWANSIQQTSDGGYIVAGGTYSFGAGEDDMYILKLDVDGNLIWQKTFGGWNYDEAYSIQQTSDGGYIVAGEIFYYDVYILKLDANGNLVWEKTFGESGYDEAYSIQQTSDGGYIVAGDTYSFGAGGYDVYILKLDANGNTGPYPQ